MEKMIWSQASELNPYEKGKNLGNQSIELIIIQLYISFQESYNHIYVKFFRLVESTNLPF